MFGFIAASFSKEKKLYKAVKNILGFYPGNIFLYRPGIFFYIDWLSAINRLPVFQVASKVTMSAWSILEIR